MNLILIDSKYVDYYTFLDKLFRDVPEFQDYLYFISDFEFNYCEDERLMNDNFFISGRELFDTIDGKGIQFIWGILSAFKQKPEKPIEKVPYADGNPHFWAKNLTPQLKNAEFEIVCFDSSFTLFIGMNEFLSKGLRALYPDIKDLDEENRSR